MTSGRTGLRACPQRTCVGCRNRAAKADLLRVVVVEGRCVPDPRGRLPGRGASLHPDPGCLDSAERRKAFPRAFRVPGPLDTSELRRYVEEQVARRRQRTHRGSTQAVPLEPKAGRDKR